MLAFGDNCIHKRLSAYEANKGQCIFVFVDVVVITKVLTLSSFSTLFFFFFFVIQGSPLRGSIPGPGQPAGQLHPGGFSLSPKAQYPFWCPDEARLFPHGGDRTRMMVATTGPSDYLIFNSSIVLFPFLTFSAFFFTHSLSSSWFVSTRSRETYIHPHLHIIGILVILSNIWLVRASNFLARYWLQSSQPGFVIA